MKRFVFVAGWPAPLERPDGEWVRYEDAQAEMTELRKHLSALRIEWEAVLEQNKRLRVGLVGGRQRTGKTTLPTEGGWDD